jgi:DNA replication protein DnaC
MWAGRTYTDVPTAGAVLDRLLQHADIIPFKGKSYRLSNRDEGNTEMALEKMEENE